MTSTNSGAPAYPCNEPCRYSTYNAACQGHLECMKYALKARHGVWDPSTTIAASAGGHLECLKYAHENGCKWDPETTYYAAKEGQLECLRYSHENGCPWSSNVYPAAEPGELECLLYSHQIGCEPNAARSAAETGELECLRYACENGCPWDPTTTGCVAEYGELECLMYIYENCGDVATWENANLEEDADVFPEEIQDFIDSVSDGWKLGLNKPGRNIKGC